jgi:hypothetical protein
MLHLGYNWDLSPTAIIPDSELNTDKLCWKVGDYWKVIECDSGKMLVRVNELEEFILKGAEASLERE